METIKRLTKDLVNSLPPTWQVRSFAISKVPLIFLTQPKVLEMNNDKVKVLIPLNRLTKNHVNSMYFGALSIGADLCCGLLAMHHINQTKKSVEFVFKDFEARFLKRCEGDVIFVCDKGEVVAAELNKAIESGERVNIPLPAQAFVPSKLGDEPAAEFVLTLSMKVK